MIPYPNPYVEDLHEIPLFKLLERRSDIRSVLFAVAFVSASVSAVGVRLGNEEQPLVIAVFQLK